MISSSDRACGLLPPASILQDCDSFTRVEADYDVVIIGSGASGGMAGYTLTRLGLRCLMLDAGPPLDFQQGRKLRAVYELPYRRFGRPGRFPHITQASE